MDVKHKQRAIIKFLTAEGCTAANIHERLKKVYGEETINVSNVRRWANKFKEGEANVEDKSRSGRPVTAVTEENKKVNDLRSSSRCRRDVIKTVMWYQCCPDDDQRTGIPKGV